MIGSYHNVQAIILVYWSEPVPISLGVALYLYIDGLNLTQIPLVIMPSCAGRIHTYI